MTSPHPHRRTRDRAEARLHRQFHRLRLALPWFDRWIVHLQQDHAALVRMPAALLLLVGGVFSFLPFFGLWMLPLAFMLLAIDIPRLRAPVASVIVRLRSGWRRWRRQLRRSLGW